MEKRKEKSDLKLGELEKGTMVAVGENKHIMEFLGIDGMYARRKPAYGKGVVIMGHANKKVSEYGEIIHLNRMIRKDSRMDLLINLLNEYEDRRKDKALRFQRTYKLEYKKIRRKTHIDSGWNIDSDSTNCEIVSKSYGFIKWLWDNEYIDYTEVTRKKGDWGFSNEMISLDEQRYCEILMLLSISEDPIRLLIYILR